MPRNIVTRSKSRRQGFDYIRLSHYPQSPAFLDACDELGLVVMNCLMGWQYFGKDPAFAELKYQECRQLVRRDRNHPSVILWEVSLNESDMPRSFIERTHAIAHEEYPGDQCYTCGWMPGYDVFHPGAAARGLPEDPGPAVRGQRIRGLGVLRPECRVGATEVERPPAR